jgi:prophage tail gpP-like protein
MSSLPVQGKQYVIQSGDTLTLIASRAYGNPSKWKTIYNANQTVLKSSNPNLVYPGEIIFIPKGEQKQKDDTAAKKNNVQNKLATDYTSIINGKEVHLMNNRFCRGIDLLAYSWTGDVAWTPGKDPFLDSVVKPYSYHKSELYLGNNLVATGKLYGVNPKVSTDGIIVGLEFFSDTADILDSTLVPPLEWYDITLDQIASKIAKMFGKSVTIDGSTGAKFDKITCGKTETAGAFLQRLASQRGFLVTTDEVSNIVIIKAKISGTPVASLEYGYTSTTQWEAKFDGRKRFASYKAISTAGDGTDISSTAKDKKVPGFRQLCLEQNDTDAGNVKLGAAWRRSKAVSDALTIPLPVSDWFDPKGNIWVPNTIIALKNPAISVPDPYNFLIKQVEYTMDGDNRAATLSVTLPTSLSGKEITEPWA